MTDPQDDGADDADLVRLPSAPSSRAALELVLASEAPAIAHHSVRSYLFARLLARHRGGVAEVDAELLFAACVLHDMGLSEVGDRGNRFEIDGADAAAELLTAQGMPAASVDAVWDAIALHSSPGLAARRSPLCELTQAGVFMDFGWRTELVDDQQGADIHRAYPRMGLAAVLADAIVGQAATRPEKAPRYSMADVMTLERSGPDGLTRMERDEPHARWAAYAVDR